MKHEITLDETQETAAQYYADLHKLSIEDMIVRDYVDGAIVPGYDSVLKEESRIKYEQLPPESQAIVDEARATQDAELAALIDAEHGKIPKPQQPIELPAEIEPGVNIKL